MVPGRRHEFARTGTANRHRVGFAVLIVVRVDAAGAEATSVVFPHVTPYLTKTCTRALDLANHILSN